MKTTPVRFQDIDAYIATFPAPTQNALGEIRTTVHAALPHAQEKISYHMPTIYTEKTELYFCAFKNHIGMYGMFIGDPALKKLVAPYAGPKGALRFPLAEPMPLKLITKIVKHQRARPAPATSTRKSTARAAKKK